VSAAPEAALGTTAGGRQRHTAGYLGRVETELFDGTVHGEAKLLPGIRRTGFSGDDVGGKAEEHGAVRRAGADRAPRARSRHDRDAQSCAIQNRQVPIWVSRCFIGKRVEKRMGTRAFSIGARRKIVETLARVNIQRTFPDRHSVSPRDRNNCAKSIASSLDEVISRREFAAIILGKPRG
jgi:hypothetical protein